MNTPSRLTLLCAALALAACGQSQQPAPEAAPEVVPAAPPPAAASAPAAPPSADSPHDAFLDRLRSHCGQAYAGRIVANQPEQPDDAFEGKALVMHVRECGQTEVKVPFHVGDDHSRTWVLTRTGTGLRLKHDHRHEDGSDDAVTMYGGDTAAPGTAQRQEFPVDAESVAMFEREGLSASVTNTWAMEIDPGQRFLYELSRPGGRLFQVEFDLTAPVDLPPTPWGHAELVETPTVR
jgi:cytochrome c5